MFDLCFSLNEFAQKIKYKFEVPVDDNEKKAAACFYIRVINGFQGTIILQKKGLASEAIVVLRGVYEAFSFLKNVVEEKGFLKKLLRDNDARRLNNLNWVVGKKFKEISKLQIKEVKSEIANLKSKNITNTDKIVIENINPKTYSLYRLFSSETHPGLSAVVRYLQDDNDSQAISWGPTSNNLEMTLVPACTIIYDSLGLMANYFNVDITDYMSNFRTQIEIAQLALEKESSKI